VTIGARIERHVGGSVIAGALSVYSFVFLWLHAIAPINWAVDFLSAWGRIVIVAAYVATWFVALDRVAAALVQRVRGLSGQLPWAVWTAAWMVAAGMLFWGCRAQRHLGDGYLLLKLISEGYRYDPQAPLGKVFQSVVFDWCCRCRRSSSFRRSRGTDSNCAARRAGHGSRWRRRSRPHLS
jgi:hypothetical protein